LANQPYAACGVLSRRGENRLRVPRMLASEYGIPSAAEISTRPMKTILLNNILRRPPEIKGGVILGVWQEYLRNPPAFLERAAGECGDIARFRLVHNHAYLLNHPDWIKEVLVTNQANFTKSRMLERARVLLGEGLLTSEDDFHRHQRRMVQPAFHRDRLAGYAMSMVECAVRCRDQWESGAGFDMSQAMMRLSMAIVARALFSADIESEADEISGALGEVFELFEALLMPFSQLLEKLPLPSVRRFERARDRLDQTVYRMIAERRATGRDTGDLLSMLLLSVDEEDGGGKFSRGLTDKQVRDEALTILLAGHETTANALTWTWYLLSQNPDAEAKLHAELNRVLAGRLPTLDDLPLLRYTESVFAESLRLYPSAWAIGRRAKQDFSVGDYVIPARSIVLMSPWVVHRDARWFPDPLKFAPERWQIGDIESRPKFSYFPFGGGARVCLGERFAWMEGVLVIATLASRLRLRMDSGQRVETRARMTLRPKYPMRMIVERRAGSSDTSSN
jgi:cytochrome P450